VHPDRAAVRQFRVPSSKFQVSSGGEEVPGFKFQVNGEVNGGNWEQATGNRGGQRMLSMMKDVDLPRSLFPALAVHLKLGT
jgi:hypothetical protein